MNISTAKSNTFIGLKIGLYKDPDIKRISHILENEFKNWNDNQINSYIDEVIKQDSMYGGIISVKNDSDYFVALLIYSIEEVSPNAFNLNKKLKKSNLSKTKLFIIERIISATPLLNKKIFNLLIEYSLSKSKEYCCDYLKLPKLNYHDYQLINKNFKNRTKLSCKSGSYLKVDD